MAEDKKKIVTAMGQAVKIFEAMNTNFVEFGKLYKASLEQEVDLPALKANVEQLMELDEKMNQRNLDAPELAKGTPRGTCFGNGNWFTGDLVRVVDASVSQLDMEGEVVNGRGYPTAFQLLVKFLAGTEQETLVWLSPKQVTLIPSIRMCGENKELHTPPEWRNILARKALTDSEKYSGAFSKEDVLMVKEEFFRYDNGASAGYIV
jgi:hypothetical protein